MLHFFKTVSSLLSVVTANRREILRKLLKSVLKTGAWASCPLSRERPAPARGQDAHATAGETAALHPSTVERFSWFLGARQPTGMSDCFENACADSALEA